VDNAFRAGILPRWLPSLPELTVAASHHPAGPGQSAADWFETVPLGGGRLAAAVGDMVDDGLESRVATVALRAAMEALLLTGCGPGEVLRRLDRVVQRVPGASGATACIVVLDPAAGCVIVASAGHPPPLLIARGIAVQVLPTPVGPPLGLVSAPRRAEKTADLRRDDMVLLYTGGTLRWPDEPQRGAGHLLGAVAGTADPEHACAAALGAVLDSGPVGDDVAVLAVGRRASLPRLDLVLPATARQLSGLRRRLRGWLDDAGADEEDMLAVQMAVGEATANVVEHAYRGVVDGGRAAAEDAPGGGRTGQMRVIAELGDDGAVQVTVADRGSWQQPANEPGDRGRGLLLVRDCMDDVSLARTPAGTTVVMRRRLRCAATATGRPAPAPPDSPAAARPAAARPAPDERAPAGSGPPEQARNGPVDLWINIVDGGLRASIAGDLDGDAADELGAQLSRRSRGGALPLVLDLTRLRSVGARGIKALFELAAVADLDIVVGALGPVGDVVRVAGLGQVAVVREEPRGAP
jgi:anti-sigma regulatory factor (Ser/Thr protein kinase)/anti-anti-sigma regulatory factor